MMSAFQELKQNVTRFRLVASVHQPPDTYKKRITGALPLTEESIVE